jgi:hypothetical protein
MILVQREITKIQIDGRDMEILKQLCLIASFYLVDNHVEKSWLTGDLTTEDIQKFVNFVLDRKEQK